jgi:hypothetical protein
MVVKDLELSNLRHLSMPDGSEQLGWRWMVDVAYQ